MTTIISIVRALLGLFLRPPEYPAIRIPGMGSTIRGWLDFFYWRGAFDGLIVGVVIALLALPRIRRSAESVGRTVPGDSD